MNWLILRTDFRKEAYVARHIQALGFDAWHPVQIIACRPSIARRITAKTQLQAYREVSILPRRVFINCPDVENLPAIRHMVGVEFDCDMRALCVPNSQITAFRAEIDQINTAALALATKASRKQKQKWRSLHDALVEMIDQAKTQLEQAA